MNRHQIERIKRRKKEKNNQEKYERKLFTNLNSFDEHLKHAHDAVNSERYHLSSNKECRLSLGIFVNGKQSNFHEGPSQNPNKTLDDIGESYFSEPYARDEKGADKEILAELEGLGQKAKHYLKALFPDMKETPDEKNLAFLRGLKSKLEFHESPSNSSTSINKVRRPRFDDQRPSNESRKNKGKCSPVSTYSAGCQTSSVVNAKKPKAPIDRGWVHFESEKTPCSSRKPAAFRTSTTFDETRRVPADDLNQSNRRMSCAHPLWDTPDALNDSCLNSSFMKNSYLLQAQDPYHAYDSANLSRTSLTSLPENPLPSYCVPSYGPWNESQTSEMQERLWRNIEDLGSIRHEADQLFRRKY